MQVSEVGSIEVPATVSSPAEASGPATTETRSWRRRWDRVPEQGRRAIVGLLVAWLAWPLASIAPINGLDASWQAALHLTHQRGIPYGSQFDFIYGPLGFLSGPRLWWTPTAVLALAFQLAVDAGLAAVLYGLLRRSPLLGRRLPALVAVLVAIVVVRLTPEVAAGELLVVVVLLCCLDLLHGEAPPRHPRLLLALGTGIAATELLVKFDAGLICTGLVLITVGGLAERRWRGALGALALIVVEVVVLALLAGQRLPDLIDWLRADVALLSGYTAAMVGEDPSRSWEYVEAAVLMAAIAGLLLVGRWRARSRVAVVLALLWAGYLELKHGFVRHDAHSVAFFLMVALVPLTLRLRRFASTSLVVAAAGLAAVAIASGGGRAQLADPIGPPRHALGQLADLVVPSRHAQLLAGARAQMTAGLAIDPATLATLRGHTVQVENYQTSAIWAYGLRWQPVPAFQLYVAYTSSLDARNVAALASEHAPERILRGRSPTIDNRFTPFDSPGYVLAEICRYRQVQLTPAWQVLARGTDRCGAARHLATVRAAPGERVPVPRVPGSVVYARIDLPDPLLDRLAEAAFRPLYTPNIEIDGQQHRLVSSTADDPLVLRVPAGAPVGPGPGGLVEVNTLALLHLPGPATIEFYAVPLGP